MRWTIRLAALLACVPFWALAATDAFYVATTGNPFGDGTQPIAGALYSVAAPGRITPLGQIRIGGVQPVGITGLAHHPATGVLYGITSESSPNNPRSLITIDAATGNATVVGRLGAAGSDIAFDAEGTLFVWLRNTSQLGTVNLTTGRSTAIGKAGPPGEPAGMAIDAKGRAYLMAGGGTGSLDQVDLATGAITKGPVLLGAPYSAGINAMTASPEGVLFAVNSNGGVPAKAALVRVDVASGQVTAMGPLPDDSDAIVFIKSPSGFMAFLLSRNGLTLAAALVLFASALAYIYRAGRAPRTGDPQ